MSEVALFSFGCVVFFIVLSGAMLYGMASAQKIFDRNN